MTRTLRLSHVALLAFTAISWGCGRDGMETPTSAGSVVRLSVVVRTTSSQAMQKAKLVFDGRDVVIVESPGGSGQMILEGMVSGVLHGSHSMKVVILQQASTPNPYSAGGSVATPERILDLATVEAVLATGESLEFRMSL